MAKLDAQKQHQHANAGRSGLSLGCSLTHRGRSGLPSQCLEDMTIIMSIVEYTPKLYERNPC